MTLSFILPRGQGTMFLFLPVLCAVFKERYITCHRREPSFKFSIDNYSKLINLLKLTIYNSPEEFGRILGGPGT